MFQLRAKAFSSMKEENFRRGKVEVYLHVTRKILSWQILNFNYIGTSPDLNLRKSFMRLVYWAMRNSYKNLIEIMKKLTIS